jgi:hypothetical protein
MQAGYLMKPLITGNAALLAASILLSTGPRLAADPVYGVAGPRGAVVSGEHGTVAVRRPAPRAVVVAPRTTVVVAPLPHGYVRVVPVGHTRVVYHGYNCFFVGGVYYRSVIYQGETVYVVVN